jgi:uncharacterized repeat protein (TIGR03833 family)
MNPILGRLDLPENTVHQVRQRKIIIDGSVGKGIRTIRVRANLMDGIRRELIKPGMHVAIVLKEDQRTGKLTEGYVKDILTKSPLHSHGIKVRLETSQVGRVQKIF